VPPNEWAVRCVHSVLRQRSCPLEVLGQDGCDEYPLRRHFVDPSRGQELTAVHYFTARSTGRGVRGRTPTFGRCRLTARNSLFMGGYMRKTVNCRACGTTWVTHEEKESDVALAVQLVQDAGLKKTLPGQHHWRVVPAR
jgi:hypothetical protein